MEYKSCALALYQCVHCFAVDIKLLRAILYYYYRDSSNFSKETESNNLSGQNLDIF